MLSKQEISSIAKSAIQKGFRRGDTGLMSWALEELGEHGEASWVTFRAPILTTEDGLHSTLAVGKAVYAVGQKVQGSYGRLKEILLDEACTYKNQDANGLQWTASILLDLPEETRKEELFILLKEKSEEQQKLIKAMMYVVKNTNGGKIPVLYWNRIWDKVGIYANNPDYLDLRAVIGACYFREKRSKGGGTSLLLFAAALLFLEEYKQENKVTPHKMMPNFTPPTSYQTDTLPWYIVDQHTISGTGVINLLMEATKKRFSREFIKNLWFEQVTGVCSSLEPNCHGWYNIGYELWYKTKYPKLKVRRKEIWEELEPIAKEAALDILRG